MIQENDVCIVYFQDLPTTFIRVESIIPDEKPKWYKFTFTELKLPVETFTWTIDESHLNGETIYMKGMPYRLQKLVTDASKKIEKLRQQPKSRGTLAKVISLADWKENRKIKEVPDIIA